MDALVTCGHCGFNNRPYDAECLFCRRKIVALTKAQRRPSPSKLPARATPDPERGTPRRQILANAKQVRYWLYCSPLAPFPLGQSLEVSVGRQHDNDLVLPHQEVSRFHARFKIAGARVTVEDNGSSNGVYINGIRRTSYGINRGDEIRIGPYEMRILGPNEGPQCDATPGDLSATAPSLAPYVEGQVALSGKLSETPLTELIQSFEFNQKTGSLVVANGREFGWLAFDKGRPHSARIEDMRGCEAALRLLAFDHGHFTFYANQPDGPGEITQSVTAMLLDLSRSLDEAGHAEGQEKPSGGTDDRRD